MITNDYCPPPFYPLFALQRTFYDVSTFGQLTDLYRNVLAQASLIDHQLFDQPCHDYLVNIDALTSKPNANKVIGASVGFIMFKYANAADNNDDRNLIDDVKESVTFGAVFSKFQNLFAQKFNPRRHNPTDAQSNNTIMSVTIPDKYQPDYACKTSIPSKLHSESNIDMHIVIPGTITPTTNTPPDDVVFPMFTHSDENYGFTTWISTSLTDDGATMEFTNGLYTPIFIYGPIMYSQMRKLNISFLPNSNDQYSRCQYGKLTNTSRKDATKFVKTKNYFLNRFDGIPVKSSGQDIPKIEMNM